MTKNTNADGILFFDFVNVPNFYWKFYVFKFKLYGKIFVSCTFLSCHVFYVRVLKWIHIL